MTPADRLISERLIGTLSAIESLRDPAVGADRAIGAVRDTIRSGGTVFTCGNGGSAAQAMHLAEELIGRYRDDREPLPAVCLNADATALTCIANDYGFEQVFARSLEALAAPGDALVVFSTSGRSGNILAALEMAREIGVATVGLLGKGGGPAAMRCEAPVIVPADDTAHIQEAHLTLLHLMLEAIESAD